MSTNPTYLGRTVALTRCPAYDDGLGGDLTVSGLWTVEEYQPVEYGAGITSEYFTLASVQHTDEDGDPLYVTVDPYALIQQIDPAAHITMLADERDMRSDADAQAEVEIDGVRDARYGQPYDGILRAHPNHPRAAA